MSRLGLLNYFQKMKKIFFAAAIAVSFYLIFPGYSFALGGYLTGDYGQVVPVELKAIIDFDGKTEKIISQQTFSFNPLLISNFYWVMAFPEKVKSDKPDSKKNMLTDRFLEIEKKTRKKFSKDNIFQRIIYPDVIEEKSVSSEIFSRMIFIKYLKKAPDFKNLSDLEAWFKINAYPIPKSSRELFAEYNKKHWHFLLALIDGSHATLDAKETLTLNAGYNIPVEVSFPAKKIIYPLKLAGIMPDRDSKDVPLSFPYGSGSESILGVKDQRVDDLLSTPSSSFNPPLLLDLMQIKIDLFVRSRDKVEAKGFTTVYADKEGGKYLTRLLAYKPLTQLSDVTIEKARDQRRVNPQISIFETVIRIIFVVVLLIILRKKISGKKQ